jgi:PPM family protein phosphatase
MSDDSKTSADDLEATAGSDAVALDIRGSADMGRVRENMEDTFVVDEGRRLAIVADGMGGHNAGEVASRIGADTATAVITGAATDKSPSDVLYDAIEAAHGAIKDASEQDRSRSGMGTTLVIAWMPDASGAMWIAHVGDSRAYLLRDGELLQLTEDHTVYNQEFLAGLLDPDPALRPPRSALTQAVGASEIVVPDIAEVPLRPGDRLLLCSDGLTDMVSDSGISSVVASAADAESAARELVEFAIKAGGVDNVTAVVIDVGGDGAATDADLGYATMPEMHIDLPEEGE